MRDQKALLEDILVSIEIIENALSEVSETEFKKDIILQDGIIRRFAVIGEATKNISSELKAKHKEVNWKNVAAMRDFLVHEYFDIDIGIIWKAVEVDLPVLKRNIKEMLKKIV
jgi:uncharacterized protein with HEPN domain